MACLDSIGVIELVGMATAIECADAAVKAANVKLLGYELSKGGGMVTIKISGNIGAVQAAVAAGTAACSKVGTVVSKIVIPRPHKDLDKIILSAETVLAVEPKEEERENGGLESEQRQENEKFIVEDAVPVNIDLAHPEEIEEMEEITESSEQQEAGCSPESTIKQNNEIESSAGNVIDDSGKATCNICNDPQCPRQKGEPHAICIHYKRDKK